MCVLFFTHLQTSQPNLPRLKALLKSAYPSVTIEALPSNLSAATIQAACGLMNVAPLNWQVRGGFWI